MSKSIRSRIIGIAGSAIALAAVVVFLSQPDFFSNGKKIEKRRETESALINLLVKHIRSTGTSARFDYHGFCAKTGANPILLSAEVDTNRFAQALESAVTQNTEPTFSIERDPQGIIRVSSGPLWRGILDVKISTMNFDKYAQFNPSLAMEEILNAKDVKGALYLLNATPIIKTGGLIETPSEDRPHLEDSLSRVSVDEGFEEILHKFKGLLVYRECVQPDGKHLFDASFLRVE